MLSILNSGEVRPALKRINSATASLLRDTIDLDEDAWRAPSLRPGWSRAHVASHVARNADALRLVITATMSGDETPWYSSDAAKFNEIERGAERSGMDLHVDLDTSAGELARLCERVDDWTVPAKLRGGEFPLSVVTLIRLQEVTLHHLDLDCGFTWERIDVVPGTWLLQWLLVLMRDDTSLPPVDIVSDAGEQASIGGAGERISVSGPDPALWAWLTGRTGGEGLSGVDGVRFPLAG